MAPRRSTLGPVSSRTTVILLASWVAVFALTATAVAGNSNRSLYGVVQSGDYGLPGYQVSLYASFNDRRPTWVLLGSASSDSSGHFRIDYLLPQGLSDDYQPVLFVEAVQGPAMLASCIGIGSGAPRPRRYK